MPAPLRIRGGVRPFNLIEIVLSMAIIGIGIASVVALFPVSVQASRDSIAENYSADAADQMLSQIARIMAENWSVSIPTSRPSLSATATSDWNSWTQGGELTGTNIYDGGSDLNAAQGKFGVRQVSGSGANATTDFAAQVLLWKSPVSCYTYSGGTWSRTTDNTNAARLNIEVSWPVEKPYSQRNKRLYTLDVFKND